MRDGRPAVVRVLQQGALLGGAARRVHRDDELLDGEDQEESEGEEELGEREIRDDAHRGERAIQFGAGVRQQLQHAHREEDAGREAVHQAERQAVAVTLREVLLLFGDVEKLQRDQPAK